MQNVCIVKEGCEEGAGAMQACAIVHYCAYQREDMGSPEYQVMPSVRDVAHDGWLFTFTT
jgi:hypothetical protein